MQKIKIFQLLATLSEKELAAFEKYVYSFNKIKNQPYEVLKFINQYYPQYDSADLESGNISIQLLINPKKGFGNLYSRLVKHLLDFLVWQKVKETSVERDNLLLQIFKERGAKKFLEEQLKEADKNLEEEKTEKGLSHFYFFKKLRLYHHRYFDLNDEQAILEIDNPNIKLILENLELFYSASKLKYHCELVQRKNILQKSQIKPNKLGNLLNPSKETNSILHQIYSKLLLVSEESDNAEFLKMKQWLLENMFQLSKDDQEMIISHLANKASKKIKQGDKSYIQVAFNIYKYAFENKVFDEYIPTVIFNNVINLGLYLNEFEWVNDFMESNIYLIENENRNNVRLLFEAQTKFKEGAFDEAQGISNTVEFKNTYYKIRSRTLFIRCAYELNQQDKDKDFVLMRCRSFLQQLNRMKDIHPVMILSYTNFIRVFRLLLNDKILMKEIKQEIETIDYLQFKHWLLEKLKERN